MQEMFNKLLLLGCGGVQQNILAVIDDFYPELDYSKVYILDKLDKRDRVPLSKAIKKGATFVQKTITRTNYASVLESIVASGEM
jgi:homospermidine synthase